MQGIIIENQSNKSNILWWNKKKAHDSQIVRAKENFKLILFVWFDSLHPINNLSVKQERVFLGWTSTKLG